MPRKKTPLAYITDNAARTTTLKKRRLNLFKKVNELSILCDVPACAVVYTPQETQPEVWPSPDEASALLNRFNSVKGFSKTSYGMNQKKLLSRRLEQLCAQLGRVKGENDELAGDLVYRECLSGRPVQNLDSYELGLLSSTLDRRNKAVQARLMQLSVSDGTFGDGSLPPPLPLLASSPLSPQLVEENFRMDGVPAAWSAGGIGGEAALPGNDLQEIGGSGTWADILGTGSEWEIFTDFFLDILPKWDELEIEDLF